MTTKLEGVGSVGTIFAASLTPIHIVFRSKEDIYGFLETELNRAITKRQDQRIRQEHGTLMVPQNTMRTWGV